MDYEKKYKESMAKMSTFLAKHDGFTISKDGEMYKELSEIFSELKESKDERIRKALIEAIRHNYVLAGSINHIPTKDILAWLEKQGEHANFRNKIQIGDKVTRNEDGVLVNLSQLNRFAKKQGEQKPADKVEPKFHEGDWVVIQESTYQITKVENLNVTLSLNGRECLFDIDVLKNARLWDITKDAKDGDVLSYNDGHGNDSIELIKSITDKKIEFWFCLTNGNRYEVFDGITPYTNLVSRKDATPATKEQRDTLMKAMTDAGYTFDFEKKELKEIEPDEWSDECCINQLIVYCENCMVQDTNAKRCANFLKSLKDRVQPQPKQEWSEEDIYEIENALFGTYAGDVATRLLNKIKSIRPQNTWKPSDEQMDMLAKMCSTLHLTSGENEIMESIYDALKKLKA